MGDIIGGRGTDQTIATGEGWISDTWNKFKGMDPGTQSAIVGGVSGAISYFTSQYPPPDPGEDMTAYMES